MLLVMTVRKAGAQADCPNEENYSPCTCTRSTDIGGVQEYRVMCYEIALAEVASVFKRTTTADLYRFTLYFSPTDPTKTIPADLLNNHRTEVTLIYCRPTDSPLIVDSQAFRSSQNLMTVLFLRDCDMSQLNFDFLSEFNKIWRIGLESMSNVGQANWASFPQFLPSFNSLLIRKSTGLNEWSAFPQLAGGSADLYLSTNDIQDDAMNRVLNWTFQYSANTLNSLDLRSNELTQIPKQLQAPNSFPNLQYLNLDDQKTGIPLITTGSISCPSSPSNYYLYASKNRITTIDAGAFQGYFIFIH